MRQLFCLGFRKRDGDVLVEERKTRFITYSPRSIRCARVEKVIRLVTQEAGTRTRRFVIRIFHS